jgi:hypothetical protein
VAREEEWEHENQHLASRTLRVDSPCTSKEKLDEILEIISTLKRSKNWKMTFYFTKILNVIISSYWEQTYLMCG